MMGWERPGPSDPETRASQLLETADALMERAHALASQAAELIAALDAAARRLIDSGSGVALPPLRIPVSPVERKPEAALSPEPPAPEPVPEPPLPSSVSLPPAAPSHEPMIEPPEPKFMEEPVLAGEPEPPPAEIGEPQVSDGARLLITQMAVAGANHEEIARRLHNEFGIEDPEATLRLMGI